MHVLRAAHAFRLVGTGFTVGRLTCSSAAGPNPSRQPRRSSHFSRGCFCSWYSADVHPRSVMKPERIHPYGVRSGSRGLVSPVVVQLYLHHLLKGCPSSLEIIGHSCGTSVTPHLSLFLGLVFPYLSDHQVCFHPLHPLPRTPYPLPGSGEEPPPRAAPTAPWSSDSEAERNVCSVGCPFLHLVAGGLPSQGHPRGPFFAARLLDKLSHFP